MCRQSEPLVDKHCMLRSGPTPWKTKPKRKVSTTDRVTLRARFIAHALGRCYRQPQNVNCYTPSEICNMAIVYRSYIHLFPPCPPIPTRTWLPLKRQAFSLPTDRQTDLRTNPKAPDLTASVVRSRTTARSSRLASCRSCCPKPF